MGEDEAADVRKILKRETERRVRWNGIADQLAEALYRKCFHREPELAPEFWVLCTDGCSACDALRAWLELTGAEEENGG